MTAVDEAARALSLPGPLRAHAAPDSTTLWIGPDQWLIVADATPPTALIERCATALNGLLHHAVDLSCALDCTALRGGRVRELLAMGSGVNWDAEAFPAGACVRTRLAQIAVVAHAAASECIELYYDRSYRSYFERWLAYASSDPSIAGHPCLSTS